MKFLLEMVAGCIARPRSAFAAPFAVLFRTSMAMILFGWCGHAAAELAFAGDVTAVSVSADAVDLQLDSGGIARIEMLDSDLARVRVTPAAIFSDRSSGAVAPTGLNAPGAAIFDQPEAVFLITADMTVVVIKVPLRVIMLRPDGSLIVADTDGAIAWDTDSGLIFNRKYAPPDEKYFGLGLRGGPLDRRGRSFVMANSDFAAYGEFSDGQYQSYPFYYGVKDARAYGLFLDNPAVPFFNMDAEATSEILFGAADGEIDYYVMAGPEPARVASTYARLTGFTQLPPAWTLGYHQSRFDTRNQQEYIDLAAEFRSRQIPVDVFYYDLYYMDLLQVFTWDPVRFPDPLAMNATLEAAGIKRVNIMDPVMITEDRLWPIFDANKWFLTDGTGESLVNNIFYGEVSWIDFSNSGTRAIYKELMKAFMTTGVTAVWNDLNEPAKNFMPEAVYDFDGEQLSDLQARNLYALNNVSLTWEGLRELRPNERPWIITRSGYSGIQRYASNWSGDLLSTWDALRVSVQVSNSMGLSGQNFFGHDIGGFLGDASAELFIRWLEFGSYIVLFRNHSTDTSALREPWVFGEPYTGMAREIIEQRYRMLPYIYSLMADAASAAAPPVAPLLFHFPADTNTYQRDLDYMLGPSLLVAPVVTEGATSRSVYLPAGSDWIDYYTDALYTGGQTVTVPAPLERIPLFVRAGAILPGGPLKQHVGDPVPPLVSLDLYDGPGTEFVLYEDDGISMEFASGEFLRTRLSRSSGAGDSGSLDITRIQGNWTPPERPWRVTVHGVDSAPGSVSLNGEALPELATEADLETAEAGWFYRASDQQLLVRFADDSAPMSLLWSP